MTRDYGDPYSLDYRGILNLLGRTDGNGGHCDLHPEFRIDADGCAYCRRIRSHLNEQLAVCAVEREREAMAMTEPEVPDNVPFPEGMAELLHSILAPPPNDGPPYTHRIDPPSAEYDDDGEELPPRIRPTLTVTVAADTHPFAAALRAVEYFADYLGSVQLDWVRIPPPAAPGMPDAAFRHTLAVKTLRAFRLKPRHLGIDLGCACHTLPNPAAHDYRRRTKHRNRRRR